MLLSKRIADVYRIVRRFLNPPRTTMSEEELFFLDNIFVPDPENPGEYTKESIIKAVEYMIERGFEVEPGTIGGDTVVATVDERMIIEARERFKRRKK